MKDITYNGTTRKIPDHLEELTPEQYMRYLELSVMMNTGEITPYQMRCKLFSLLLNLKVNFLICSESIVNELNAQLGTIDGFFNIQEENGVAIYDPILYSGRNLLPVYRDWIGPDDMLNNITFGNFVSCLHLMVDIGTAYQDKRHEDIEYLLSDFCQVLYRHKNNKIEPTPVLLNLHAFNFFSAVWELIRTVPIPISGKDIDFSILFQEPERNNRDDKTGWTGITFEVASSGVFGNVRQVNDSPFWDVLIYLYKCRFESIHFKTNDK